MSQRDADPNGEVLGRPLARWVAAVRHHHRLVLVLAALVTALLGLYAARSLGVDTDTSGMFADDLPFRRYQEELKAAFPQLEDTLLAVVDGPTADRARSAAEELYRAVAEDTETFRSAFLASAHPWFQRNGLLFLSSEELTALTEKLRPLAPWLAFLRKGPNLPTFLDSLRMAVALRGDELPAELLAVLDGVGAAARAQGEGRDERLSWSGVLAGKGGPLTTTRQVIVTQPVLDYSSFVPAKAAVERLRTLAADAPEDVQVRLTGEVAMAQDELGQARDGAALAGVLSLVLVAVFLVIGLHSPRLVVASLVTLLAGLVWTAGFAAAVVGHLNLISIAFAVLYISLGVAFAIHYGLRYAELCMRGMPWENAQDETARDVGTSLFVAAATTALGFLAFVPTDFVGVAELGIIAGGGVMISLFASLTLLPALLTLPLLRPRFRHWVEAHEDIAAPAEEIEPVLERHAVGIRLGAMVVGAAGLVALTGARFDPDPLHLRDPASESVQAFEALAESSRTTPYRIEVLAPDAARGDALAAELTALEPVAGVVRLESFVPRDQAAKLATLGQLAKLVGEEPAEKAPRPGLEATRASLGQLRAVLAAHANGQDAAGAPAVASLAAELERFEERLDGLPRPAQELALLDLEERLLGGLSEALVRLREATEVSAVTADDIPADLRAQWVAADGRRRLSVLPRADLRDAAARLEFVTAVRAVAPEAAGGPVVITDTGQIAVGAFQRAFAYALGAIALILVLLLRKPLDVALVLGLLVLTGAATVGATVALGLEFNFANVIALPLLLGMGVDNAVHMIHRWRAGTAGNILHTSTARAVLFASLITLGGFGTLTVSPHPGTASMGLLLTIGIAATLLCTLIVLPAVLVGRPSGREAAAE